MLTKLTSTAVAVLSAGGGGNEAVRNGAHGHGFEFQKPIKFSGSRLDKPTVPRSRAAIYIEELSDRRVSRSALGGNGSVLEHWADVCRAHYICGNRYLIQSGRSCGVSADVEIATGSTA